MNKDDEMVVCVLTGAANEIAQYHKKCEVLRGTTREYCTLKFFQSWLSAEQLIKRRGDVENDPNYRQIIPYTFFYRSDYDETGHRECYIYAYMRGKGVGEERLQSKMSVGFGGHIREGETVLAGLRRELRGEVACDNDFPNDMTIISQLIREDDTDVNRVHLGVVFPIRLDSCSIWTREPELICGGWRAEQYLQDNLDQLEDWSRIVVLKTFAEKLW